MSSGYREFAPPAAVAPVVLSMWEHAPRSDCAQRVVPDGCIDLIWLAGNEDDELVVAGSDTGPWSAHLPGGRISTGIRLRPGAAGAFLGRPASDVRDQRVSAEALWGPSARRLHDLLAQADPAGRRHLLATFVAQRTGRPDGLVMAAARQLGRPGSRVVDIAARLGISERQLHRRTLAAVGYGPKTLARVARLLRLVATARADLPLAEHALRAGYASQSHLSDEVRRLTGSTPVRFLEDLRAPSA